MKLIRTVQKVKKVDDIPSWLSDLKFAERELIRIFIPTKNVDKKDVEVAEEILGRLESKIRMTKADLKHLK